VSDLREIVTRASRRQKLDRIKGSVNLRDQIRFRSLGTQMIAFIRVAAESGCPVAKRLMNAWDSAGEGRS